MSICPKCGKPISPKPPNHLTQVFRSADEFVASATHTRLGGKYHQSDEWVAKVVAFAAQAQPGDVFAEYQWQAAPLMGGQGWYLLRDGYVVAELPGWVS